MEVARSCIKKIKKNSIAPLANFRHNPPTLPIEFDFPSCRNLLGWWKDNQLVGGQVTQLTLDMLSIPGMSAEYERAFSSAKAVINSHPDN